MFGELWLQPGGDVALLGVAVETTFLRGALDKLGVTPQLEQRHEYKNAADRVMRTGFTEAHRESLDRLTESLYETAVAAIAEGRGLTPERVRELVDTGPADGARGVAGRSGRSAGLSGPGVRGGPGGRR